MYVCMYVQELSQRVTQTERNSALNRINRLVQRTIDILINSHKGENIVISKPL